MIAVAVFAVFWAAIHPVVSGSPLRARLVASLGEEKYRGVFALLSLAGVVGVSVAYRYAPYVPVWTPPAGLRHALAGVMLLAFLLAVIGVATPSPTSAGREKLLEGEEAARGVVRVTRHPFLVAVALWSAAHLLARGDAASMWFFGSFLYLGITGPLRIDRRQRARFGAAWERFAAKTSIVPFAAIIAGRNRLSFAEIGIVRLAVALALYLGVLLLGHRLLFGVSPLPPI